MYTFLHKKKIKFHFQNCTPLINIFNTSTTNQSIIFLSTGLAHFV